MVVVECSGDVCGVGGGDVGGVYLDVLFVEISWVAPAVGVVDGVDGRALGLRHSAATCDSDR